MTFDLDRNRRLASSITEPGKLARALEDACDEVSRLRDELTKTVNCMSTAAYIARKALEEEK